MPSHHWSNGAARRGLKTRHRQVKRNAIAATPIRLSTSARHRDRAKPSKLRPSAGAHRAQLRHTKSKGGGFPLNGFVEPRNIGRTISDLRRCPSFCRNETVCYTCNMTKLLQQAFDRLRQLPSAAQDSAARALISQLEEDPEPGDREAIEKGREAFGRSDFVTLKDWRHKVGLGDH